MAIHRAIYLQYSRVFRVDVTMLPNKPNQWTPVALSADVPKGIVVPGWIPDGAIALWRSQSGTLAASSDRCPHRGMRLSYGFVRGETLSCIYHGWNFSNDGRCRRIPAHPGLSPPETINLQNSAVEECDGVIWVAREKPDTRPPALTATSPLRSMTVSAGVSALETAAEAKSDHHGVISCTLAGDHICLLVVPKNACETLVHMLVGEDTTVSRRMALSRAAEILRRKAETVECQEDA